MNIVSFDGGRHGAVRTAMSGRGHDRYTVGEVTAGRETFRVGRAGRTNGRQHPSMSTYEAAERKGERFFGIRVRWHVAAIIARGALADSRIGRICLLAAGSAAATGCGPGVRAAARSGLRYHDGPARDRGRVAGRASAGLEESLSRLDLLFAHEKDIATRSSSPAGQIMRSSPPPSGLEMETFESHRSSAEFDAPDRTNEMAALKAFGGKNLFCV